MVLLASLVFSIGESVVRSYFSTNSLEEFHQLVVLVYAENVIVISFLDIFDLLNSNPNDASAYVHVERSEIWVKKMKFLVKKYVFSIFQSFYSYTFFSSDVY